MKKFALSCLLLALIYPWAGSVAQATTTLTLTPSASTVALGVTLTLTAAGTGAATSGMTWTVNGVTNGNSTTGLLTGSGLTRTYAAPAVNVPNPNPVVFKVTNPALALNSNTVSATVTTPIAVSISPTSKSLALSATQLFTATISNTMNTALNWYVNGVLNGNSTQGTLTGSGLTRTYTAPPVDVPSPNPAIIEVASAADPSKLKTAPVTVTDSITVTLSPTSKSLALGAAQVFTASISGTSNTALNWYVNGVLNGNSTQGTLAGTGLTRTYTAPSIDVPGPNPAAIEVMSAADPSKCKTAPVTVTDSIGVTLTPTSKSLALGGTQVFTATISNTTNTTLNWSVNGVLNGNSTQGTLTGTGLTRTYTAPPVDVPSPNPAVIEVASAADPGKNKTAPVTVTDSIAVTLTPTSKSLALAGAQVFTATITGATTNSALNWYVNGVVNGNSTQGALTACSTVAPLTCTYTAPPVDVPSPNPAVIKVASSADPGKNKTANVTVTDSIAVTLSPTSASVALAGTQVFTATISGTTNTALSWYINGVKNGSSSQGTLTACSTAAPWTCKYTAPTSTVPNPNPAVIEVASAADPGKNKTANVTVTDSIAVTLIPPSPSVALAGTQMFTATISGATNTALSWYVNGVKNGNSTEGTLTACTTTAPLTCLYTAPSAAAPSPNPAVIEVASVADPSKTKTANVTVTAAISVGLSPSSASVALGGTQVFTATISGATSPALNWYVNGVKNGNATQGTLTGCTTTAPWTCIYTAPSTTVPSPNPAVIEVASVANPSASKTANVTVSQPAAPCTDTGSESLLSGQYAFSLTGYNPTGYVAVVGSLNFNGSGKFTAGEVDSNGALGLQSAVSLDTTNSKYSVGSNHLGCATIVTSFGTFNLRLSAGGITSIPGMGSGPATAGRLVEWDSPTSSTYFAATGQFLQQTAADFSGGFNGRYVWEQSGVDKNNARQAGVGQITASAGSFTGGEKDMNDAGTLSNTVGVTGSYTTSDVDGRSTNAMTWTVDSLPGHVAEYMVSTSQFLYMTTDSSTSKGVQAGVSQLQTVPAGGFGSGSVDGNMVLYWTGLTGGSSGGSAQIGLVSSTGNGSMNITTYENDAGSWNTPNPSSSTCGYSIDSYGRMTFTSGECQGAGYLSAANTSFLITPGSTAGIGQVVPQVASSGGFASTSLLAEPLYDGDGEVVSYGVANNSGSGVEVITPTGSGTVNIVGDYTSAGSGNQDADQTNADAPLGTVGSNGTFSTNPDQKINAIMISTSEAVLIDHSTSTYPVVLLLKQ